jgi:hypothetical protein
VSGFVRLHSSGLLSKWGFSDGDLLADCLQGLSPSTQREVLRRLVRRFLLPALARTHEIEVYEIGSHHNPIRASIVDGHSVDDGNRDEDIELTPSYVDVPIEAVLAIAGAYTRVIVVS